MSAPDVRAVLEVIRALDKESPELHPLLYARQVTERLGVAEHDEAAARALTTLADEHYIEPVHKIEQRGPMSFRLSY
jgi:hypothetical protein